MTSAGNLYVADSGNLRVLGYDTPFAHCGSFPCVGGQANLVIGQNGSFTSVNSDEVGFPNAIALDPGGNLYVADEDVQSENGDFQVVEFNAPLSSQSTANLQFGDFDNQANIATDSSGNLYIGDGGDTVSEYSHATDHQ